MLVQFATGSGTTANKHKIPFGPLLTHESFLISKATLHYCATQQQQQMFSTTKLAIGTGKYFLVTSFFHDLWRWGIYLQSPWHGGKRRSKVNQKWHKLKKGELCDHSHTIFCISKSIQTYIFHCCPFHLMRRKIGNMLEGNCLRTCYQLRFWLKSSLDLIFLKTISPFSFKKCPTHPKKNIQKQGLFVIFSVLAKVLFFQGKIALS